jgi:hypothetical protein
LWITAVPTGSTLSVGSVGAPTGNYWAFSQVKAGGDGTTAPPANLNTTGFFIAPQGVVLNTTGTQQPCGPPMRYVMRTLPGDGATTADSIQQCRLSASGTYSWVTVN